MKENRRERVKSWKENMSMSEILYTKYVCSDCAAKPLLS